MVSHSAHRQSSHPSRKWLWAAVVIVLVGGAAVVALAMKKTPRSAAAGCPHAVRQLRVAAAPDIAPAVAAVAKQVNVADCNPTRITVTAVDSAAEAAALGGTDGTTTTNVWIPDSSVWLNKVTGVTVSARSVARTPTVLAMASSAAHGFGAHPTYDRIAASATTASPVVLAIGDPSASTPTLGVLLGLHASLASTPSGAGSLSAMLQNASPLTNATLAARPTSLNGSPIAVASTEQAVWAADRSSLVYTAVYPKTPAPSLDYPFVVVGPRATRDSTALLSALTSAKGQGVLAAHGFRSAAGVSGSALRAASGVDAAAQSTGSPSQADANSVLQALSVLRKPSRILALLDVSGSMANTVPGLGASTRIEVARTAAAEGLGILPAESAVGLWRFSSGLTSTTDYQQLVPVSPLGDATRSRLAGAVGQLRAVPNGGTGLYDSILAAVQSMRTNYDNTRVSSVVVLTDGKDEFAKHPVALTALLSALKAESGSKQPVKVIAIAYGPDTDTGALRSIAAASGGILYTSADPRDLPQIFRNAIGRRV